MQNPTELPCVSPNFLEFPRSRPHSTKSDELNQMCMVSGQPQELDVYFCRLLHGRFGTNLQESQGQKGVGTERVLKMFRFGVLSFFFILYFYKV